MIASFLLICGVLALFGVLAAITAVWERLPTYPPYSDDDLLDEPTVRCRRYKPHPEAEWIIDG